MLAIRSLAAILGCCILLPLAVAEQAEPAKPDWQTADWPQWRGERRDGVSDERGLLASWPEGGPKELWRRSLGEGFSAISVVDGVLYTQYVSGEDALLVALAAKDGKRLWQLRTGKRFSDSYGNGPRATPTVDAGVVFALDSGGGLVAANAKDGRELWRHDLVAKYGARPPRWGLASSPLVEGGRVIVHAGGEGGRSVLAFDRTDGRLVWSSRDEKPGYAAPIAIDAAGQRQLILFAGDRLVSLDPNSGSTLWEWTWKTDWGVNASTPIWIAPDRLFLSSGYSKGATMLRLLERDGVAAVEEIWRNREMRNKFSSSVLYDGMLFGFDDSSLKCVDPNTGETAWRQRGLGHGSLLAVDGKLLLLSDRGRLVLAAASADGYAEFGSTQLFETKTWTVPTLAGGRLYVRDEKEIVALDLVH
jgi:outer membrane protein assembly factor BamB